MNFYACQPTLEYQSYADYPVYEGPDLGLSYSSEQSILKVWSPAVEDMTLFIYEDGHSGQAIETHPMRRGKKGIWNITLEGDYGGKYYNFQTTFAGKKLAKVPDPYAKAVGLNGHRAMFLDLKTTNPEGWENDQSPPLENPTDAVLYELHVRDASAHPEAGIKNKRQFMGLVEPGTKNKEGLATGLDHFKDLGVTHIHLLPAFDYMERSIDEANPLEGFNWGYDPHHYNVPEGSYSSNPYDGAVRIKEFKQMVKGMHDNGIRVVMDVVYNHTGMTEESIFNQIAPGYYYRFSEDGNFSNASGCGNETASERPMTRKFILESMKHWVEEYHVDGFRIDLMAIHDIETINLITKELRAIDPSILVYGEGWMAGDTPLPFEQRALKQNALKLDHAAVFSDDIRDGIKGSVFDHDDQGFASGKPGLEESIKFGIVAATQHPQINYPAVNYSDHPYANQPGQCINYASCHDNHTLYDRLTLSNHTPEGGKNSQAQLNKMHRLANTIVMTSQGIPFLHAGSELLRSKGGDENSYKSPESVNWLRWDLKKEYQSHFTYYKNLVALRKNHPAFRMPTTEMIQKHLSFLPTDKSLVIAYQIKDHANGDDWKDILVIFNGNTSSIDYDLPGGQWTAVVFNDQVEEDGFGKIEGRVEIGGSEAGVFWR